MTFSAVARVPDLRTGAAASQVGTQGYVYVLARGRCAHRDADVTFNAALTGHTPPRRDI